MVNHYGSLTFILTITCHRRSLFFFFNDTATTEIYTLSLHDALPILRDELHALIGIELLHRLEQPLVPDGEDRKSTRLNSSHGYISYAVFCLKKKKAQINHPAVVQHKSSDALKYLGVY